MTSTAPQPLTFGLIIGTRGFFPDHLASSGRQEMIKAIRDAGFGVVALDPTQSKFGAVETREEARKCAALFRENRDAIAGIIVSLPNFGDERAIADTLRAADLPVPVLVQATPDTPSKMSIRDRRDSFCGKMSACNNLTQYGIPYSLTTRHTETPDSDFFKRDLDWFAGVCRVVRGLRRLRVGAIGARPAAFNTVRYSEKILEANGISIEPIDLSEILGRIERMKDADDPAQQKLAEIKRYVSTSGIPDSALMKMAKLGAVVDGWMEQTDVAISAVQCWTSMEEYFGVVPAR
jgi:L-fucose isomerase-like protein